jgi:coiled-coil and C2 domain-containing protein 1
MFKKAAIESKRKGDIQQAKEYLRAAKGFEPLIEATQNGLPIDATSIPTPPQLTEDFVVVSHPVSDDTFSHDTEREEMYRKVELELTKQIEMCRRNTDHFLKLGDVSSSSKFEKFTVESCKDLDMLRIHWRNGNNVPLFKYETRSFSIVICNPDLGNDEAEVHVVKAINIPGKSDIDTYVRLEFPFPTETPQIRKTRTVRDSVNPEFKETFKFEMDRKSRSLVRVLKRHPLKVELWSKGGFLRSDTLIGTAAMKLTEFESKCTLHEAYPLMEGRKSVGGSVEVVAKIREPLLSKQVEEVREKWLVFT